MTLLAVLALSACVAPEEHAWPGPEGARPALEPATRLPDIPDAFRAELRGGIGPDCPLFGNAVNLGGGRFLTSAHLVDGIVPQLHQCAGTPIPTTIRYAGRVLPVTLLRMGQGHLEPGVGPIYRDGEDLALLQAPVSLPGPAAQPCADGPDQGQTVLVLSARRREETRAGSMMPENLAADGAYADIGIPLSEGESGAGVFDARSLCLLGVVSHRPDATPDHTRIVPAAVIRAFIAG